MDQLEHGPSWYREEERKHRVEIFDKFVDLALDSVITSEQAFVGYLEQCDAEGYVLKPVK